MFALKLSGIQRKVYLEVFIRFLFRFNTFVGSTDQVTEDHNTLFQKHQNEIDGLNTSQTDFKVIIA